MNFMDKQVHLLHKQAKGEITVQSIIKFLERRGYSVVFFNTTKGNALLSSYNITPEDTAAFSICGTTKTVFVDDLLHTSDKRYALLHECGHIVLGHVGNNQIRMQDERKTENEAEAFAYKVLNYSPQKTLRNAFTSLIAALLIITGSVFFTRAYIPPTTGAYTPSKTSSVMTVPRVTSNETSSETVYVTASGTKYHRASCRYVKSKNASELKISEAEKTHDPCSVCKP